LNPGKQWKQQQGSEREWKHGFPALCCSTVEVAVVVEVEIEVARVAVEIEANATARQQVTVAGLFYAARGQAGQGKRA
jgi:hypothetical protein